MWYSKTQTSVSLCMCMGIFLACIPLHHMQAWCSWGQKRPPDPWSWNHRQLWAAIWVPGSKPRPPREQDCSDCWVRLVTLTQAAASFKHSALQGSPGYLVLKQKQKRVCRQRASLNVHFLQTVTFTEPGAHQAGYLAGQGLLSPSITKITSTHHQNISAKG